MDPLPIAFDDEALRWAENTVEVLNQYLQVPDFIDFDSSELDGVEPWIPPNDTDWGLLIFSWLLENIKPLWEEHRSHKPKRIVLERFVGAVAQWGRNSIQTVRRGTTQGDEHSLALLIFAQKSAELYLAIHGKGLQYVEGWLLQNVFLSGKPVAIRMGVDFLVQAPPSNWKDVSLAISPLMQTQDWSIDDVFPKLLESTNPSVLSPALDLANYVVRSRQLSVHPGKPRFDALLLFLGGIVRELELLEEDPKQFGSSVDSIQRILFDSVSICVSLCDFMGLSNNPAAIGKLNQAIELSHRRIKTEAAFALAKLGQKSAEEMLLTLASDPLCRLRCIAYAQELGIEDRLDERWTTSLSKAESELVTWLSQNEQMGIAPQRLELVEQRTLYWPGYDAPQECFLFRFEYDLGGAKFSNIGMAGPMTHAFAEDLANVPIEDAFAIFAGWDVDHPDAYEVPESKLVGDQYEIAAWLHSGLEERGYEVQAIEYLGVFFEYRAIVATCKLGDRIQPVVFDGTHVIASNLASASQTLLYLQWKGRNVMEGLNPH